MAKPWLTIDRFETPDGPLELRQRGEGDFLITVDGRVLMNSHASRSEEALAGLTCARLAHHPAPRILVGGLGMGCTLRVALDVLPADAQVTVCELNPAVADWCRGPLSGLNGAALDDPRVSLIMGDVSAHIRDLADRHAGPRSDAILLDLYEGPHAATDAERDPFYGARALRTTRRALAADGCFAIWSEGPDSAFERRLGQAGFGAVALHRPGRGGRRHAVYVATAGASPEAGH
jgi:spermidine synthase